MSENRSLTTAYQAATDGALAKPVYVLRWNEHEYEPGWGVDDNESHLSLYKTAEEAHEAVESQFQDGRSLHGAGDYFIYPSGPDHAYHLFKIYVPEGHLILDLLRDHDAVNIPRLPREKFWDDARRSVTMEMQSDRAECEIVPYPGLSPKPMTSEPVIYFIQPK